jgi:hypothetical protein
MMQFKAKQDIIIDRGQVRVGGYSKREEKRERELKRGTMMW